MSEKRERENEWIGEREIMSVERENGRREKEREREGEREGGREREWVYKEKERMSVYVEREWVYMERERERETMSL